MGGILQVGDFEDKSHRRSQRDTIIGDQGQNFIIVHDGVEGFDPLGVDVSIEHAPFVDLIFDVFLLTFVLVLHEHGQDSILPFLGFAVTSIKLVRVHGLGVDGIIFRLLSSVDFRLSESLPDF